MPDDIRISIWIHYGNADRHLKLHSRQHLVWSKSIQSTPVNVHPIQLHPNPSWALECIVVNNGRNSGHLGFILEYRKMLCVRQFRDLLLSSLLYVEPMEYIDYIYRHTYIWWSWHLIGTLSIWNRWTRKTNFGMFASMDADVQSSNHLRQKTNKKLSKRKKKLWSCEKQKQNKQKIIFSWNLPGFSTF